MQISQAVSESWPQMQERRRRPVKHTPVAIRSARYHPLEERQHTAHALDFIECGDEVHLRRSRISEADIHPTANQRAHQAFCTVHGVLAPLPVCSFLWRTPRRTLTSVGAL